MSEDAAKLLAHIKSTIGDDSEKWEAWPGGWPGDIESALIDSVFSARAVYRTKRGRGVYALVVRWQGERSRTTFSTKDLAEEIAKVSPEKWAAKFGSSQHSPNRPATAPGGPTKAAAVLEACNALQAVGILTADDITDENAKVVKQRLKSVPGIGYATANYFLMLLGRPGVKPDRMVHRFLETVLGPVSNAEAEELVRTAAQELGVRPEQLDHAIWKWESDPEIRTRD